MLSSSLIRVSNESVLNVNCSLLLRNGNKIQLAAFARRNSNDDNTLSTINRPDLTYNNKFREDSCGNRAMLLIIDWLGGPAGIINFWENREDLAQPLPLACDKNNC